MNKVAVILLNVYKKTLSPSLKTLFGGGCRYSPTCSEYFTQAVEKYGIAKGSAKGIKRLLSCNPYSKKPHLDPLD